MLTPCYLDFTVNKYSPKCRMVQTKCWPRYTTVKLNYGIKKLKHTN